ncbi:MAG: tetratricopeptide repeat protein [candidate division WOR-3 bacterium]|nr:MAG: tetratricopeptide repeat protein [candidate division WOR-3 bacterium]
MFDIFNVRDPQKALQKAHELIREGKANAAIQVLENNLTDDSESYELYQELARLYYDIDQRGRAVELLRRVQGMVPSRTDEVIAQLSDLFYRHTSIDAGEFLMRLYISQHKYDEISKILLALTEHEIDLLIRKYEKIKQGTEGKSVILKNEFESIVILSSLKFCVGASEEAVLLADPLMAIDVFKKHLLSWARVVGRERYNDSFAVLLLLKVLLANEDFEAALTQTQRIFDKFPEVSDALIDILSSAQPPPALQPSYTQMLTDLYITKGDLDTSIEQLQQMLEENAKDIDTIIKDLRKLEVANPKDIKILYTLADAYMRAKRIPLAINELDKIYDIDENQYDEVLKRYRHAFEIKRNDPFVIQSLVSLYLKRGDIDAAVDTIELVYNLDPGLLNEYILNLNAILEKDPDNVKALYLIGQCYARKGDRESALLVFHKLMDQGEHEYTNKAATEISELYPEDVEYVSLRASSLVLLGKTEEAMQACMDYLEAEPEGVAQLFPAFDLIVSKDPNLFSKIEPLYKRYRRTDAYIAELALARAYAYTGAYRKSVSSFEKCLKEEEQRETTKRALIEVIKEKPKAVPLLLAAARIFITEGEVEIATQFFKTAQMVDPQAFFEIINEFYDAIKSFPKDREARTLLVETFYSRGMWDKVIEESRRAIEVFDKDAQYFNLKLGQALVETGKLSDAVRPLMISLDGEEDYSNEVIEGLDRILKTDKSNVPAHFARGRALSKAGRIDEAVDEYMLTARILPTRAGHVLAELKVLASRAMAHPKIMFALGIIELGQKRYDNAIDDLTKASELDSSLVHKVIPVLERLHKKASTPLLSFSLAKLYSLAGLRTSAVELFSQAQEQDTKYREPVVAEMKRICTDNPEDVECRKHLSAIYFENHNWEDILVLFEEIYNIDRKESVWIKDLIGRILQVDVHSLPSYYFLARIFVDEGAYEKAIEVYKKMVDMTPTEALNVMNTLSTHRHKSPEMLLYLGDLYIDSGYGKESVEVIDELLSIDSSYAEAIASRLDLIIQKYPDIGGAYLLRSRVCSMRGDFDNAVRSIERALQLMPGREDIVIRLGQLLHEAGETGKAIGIFTELLQSTKDRNTIYRMIRTAREDYYKEKIVMLQGEDENTRLERAYVYLMMDKIKEAERDLKFESGDDEILKRQTILRARLFLKKKRPIDALEIMQTLSLDKETAETYADIYEAMGSFGAAALALRQAGVDGMEQRINTFERLAQTKRATKGKYFVEGRT